MRPARDIPLWLCAIALWLLAGCVPADKEVGLCSYMCKGCCGGCEDDDEDCKAEAGGGKSDTPMHDTAAVPDDTQP